MFEPLIFFRGRTSLQIGGGIAILKLGQFCQKLSTIFSKLCYVDEH